MAVCAVKGCPALAEPADLCAVHRTWKLATIALRCARCRKNIRPGQWYRDLEGGLHEHSSCKPAPDDAKADK